MANHSFEDIKNKLLDVLESPEAKIARTTGIAALSVAKPVTGVAVAGADAFLEGYRNFNLRLLLIGMSSGLNIEMQLNKLYDFVTTSDNNAITAANVFRDTINAACPRVCIIYGLILSKHLDKKTDFSYPDFIVCRALEQANDIDLVKFTELMERYTIEYEGGRRIGFPEKFEQKGEYLMTCNWCVYNRIFEDAGTEWENMEYVNKNHVVPQPYILTEASYLLKKYLDEATPILEYSFKRD